MSWTMQRARMAQIRRGSIRKVVTVASAEIFALPDRCVLCVLCARLVGISVAHGSVFVLIPEKCQELKNTWLSPAR